MRSFIDQAQIYADQHQSPLTRGLHMVGVPLILLSLMILLGCVHIVVPGWFDINIAVIATIVLIIYYLRLNWRLALTVTPILILLLWIGTVLSSSGPTRVAFWAFISTFIVGGILQVIGYFMEDSRPPFISSLWQVPIVPLLLVADLFFKLGRMRTLKDKIYGEDKE